MKTSVFVSMDAYLYFLRKDLSCMICLLFFDVAFHLLFEGKWRFCGVDRICLNFNLMLLSLNILINRNRSGSLSASFVYVTVAHVLLVVLDGKVLLGNRALISGL